MSLARNRRAESIRGPDLRATLRGDLDRLHRALGVTSVYVTHDREDAAALADRIVEMRQGGIVTVHEAEHRERHS